MSTHSFTHLKREGDQVIRRSREAARELALLRLRHRYLARLVSHGEPWVTLKRSAPPEVKLSEREREVLRLLVGGQSTKEVGATLGISFRTAACHRSSIMQKLGVHETASLVRRALQWGLVPLDDSAA